jgi:hypothetical protein
MLRHTLFAAAVILTLAAPGADARTGPNPGGRVLIDPLGAGTPERLPDTDGLLARAAQAAGARLAAPATAQAVNAPLAAGAVQLDSTWYDIQDMASLGARVVFGGDGRVHVTWEDDFCNFDVNGCPPNLNLPNPHPLRGMGYAYRDAAQSWHYVGKAEDPTIRGCCISEVWGGFGALGLTNDGRAIIASHMNEDGCDQRGDLYIQNTAGLQGWKAYLTPITGDSYLFPQVAATPGGSFVVLGEIPRGGSYDETNDFRVSRIAAEGPTFTCPTGWQGGAWTQVMAPVNFPDGRGAFPSIAVSSNGRVGVAVGDFGGNVFLVESSDGTFAPATVTIRNLTNYSVASITAPDSTSTQFRPYVSCHVAYNDTTPHVVWSELQARRIGGVVAYFDHRSRIRHWSSVDGLSTVKQVQAGEADTYDDVDQGLSGPLCGFNTISVDWPQVGFSADGSEAYVVWLRFVDGEVDPTGDYGLPGIVTGIGFGDVACSVKREGQPWSTPQNVTQTPITDERFVSIASRNPGGMAHLFYQSSATNEAGVAAIGDRGGQPGNMLRRLVYLERALTGSVLDVGDAPVVPRAGTLRAFPNPARGSVHFAADVARARQGGSVNVYSAAGRRVARIPLDGTQVYWNGRDAQGRAVPSGLYFARLDDEPEAVSTKFLLLH